MTATKGKLLSTVSERAYSWYRWLIGDVYQPRYRRAARLAGVQPAYIIATMAVMRDNAARSRVRGSLERWSDEDCAEVLGCDETDVAKIRAAMQGIFLDGDALIDWDKEQPRREREDRTNAERQARYRAKKTQERRGVALRGVTPSDTPPDTTRRHDEPDDAQKEENPLSLQKEDSPKKTRGRAGVRKAPAPPAASGRMDAPRGPDWGDRHPTMERFKRSMPLGEWDAWFGPCRAADANLTAILANTDWAAGEIAKRYGARLEREFGRPVPIFFDPDRWPKSANGHATSRNGAQGLAA